MEVHHISSDRLTIAQVGQIIASGARLALSADAVHRITACREYLDAKIETATEPIYGITTGFGSLCNISISRDKLEELQRNLVMSHSCCTGQQLPAEIVRLMMLLKIQSLSYGNSGVQLATVERLVDMYNHDLLPVIFDQGSLGASGDLAPLAQMSLPLIGLGEVEYRGERMASADAFARVGLEPVRLQSKEGLARSTAPSL